MNIKNYTSSVPVERSVSLIEHELVRAGAQHIAKSYDQKGNLEGIMFQLSSNGMPITFQLPAKWKQCFKMMMQEVRRPKPTTEETVTLQAQRTAWKILYDWVTIQVSMIKLEQAEVIEVFLPYMFNVKEQKTFFEIAKEKNFKGLLGTGKE
ncbi:MAG: hypothetical protein WAV48_04585 [Candidatus Magasanikiibacteriota bacterium]